MESVGDCYDNALCESFFATLECELLDQRTFRTRDEGRREVFAFIEGWYNPHQRHSALGYETPAGYDRRYHREGSGAEETAEPVDVASVEHRGHG